MAGKMTPDRTLVEQQWSRGIVRDRPRASIPDGGIYDCTDMLVEQPGKAYKRGGWERHSAAIGSETSVAAVATIHLPTRVVAVAGGNLYDVTSETSPIATLVGACHAPGENPPQYVDRLIFCHADSSAPPKKVYTTGGGGTVTVANLGGSPPSAAHSTVYASRIVLGRGDGVSVETNRNRLWFSPAPDVEATWNTTDSWIDTTYEITGLATVQGTLLIFSPTHVERILGDTPPGGVDDASTNMQLQPAAGVGCLDARSIVDVGGEILFAGEEGVWATNGSGARSLIRRDDQSGIQTYWRSLFPSNEVRQVVGGLMRKDFYILCILDASNAPVDTLTCHLPTQAWTRLTNVVSRMFAQGRTEDESMELFSAAAGEGYVHRMHSMLTPTAAFKNDGNGTAVAPTFTFRTAEGRPGLKAWGHGRLSYDLRDEDSDDPTLEVQVASGVEAPTFATAATLTETADEQRKRFNVNRDAQAVTVSLTQSGPSAKTELYALELEARPYDEPSEGVGP